MSGFARERTQDFQPMDHSRLCRRQESSCAGGHAPANPAAEIKNRACRAGELPCQFDFVASEIVAVTVEEVRLRGEDRLIPSGILIEIDACHQLSSCIGPGAPALPAYPS